MSRKRHPDTGLVHTGRDRQRSAGAVNIPPYRASTVLFESLEAFRQHDESLLSFRYGRQGTPTTRALEDAYAQIEHAAGAVAVCSGLAAAGVTLSTFLSQGDHLLISAGAYEPTVHYARQVLGRMGVDVELFPPRETAGIAARIKPNTRMLFLESPSSLSFEIQDVPALSAMARAAAEAHGGTIVIAVDNTWATGLLHRPLQLGADIVVQSATKHIIGHSDALLGLIACNEATLPQVRRNAALQGICASPDDCWLALRGLRTMRLRLSRHEQTALQLAHWLRQRDEVAEVIHPALPEHPDRTVFLRDFDGSCGLFAFRLQPGFDEEALRRMLDGMQLFGMGYSFGAFESLLIPAVLPAYRETERSRPGILMRLHAGLEEPADLLADLEAGIKRLHG